jgi:UDP-N-acetylmuramoyl-tripeptide--D-alanyl-D-alanine ligase
MTAPLWSATDLAEALGTALPTGARDVNGISIDTRTLLPGDLFVALEGERDGHDFVAVAFAKGAAAALVAANKAPALRGHGALYAVENTLRALERLGRAARARSKARIVAVTGSVGKTGTKEALRIVLSRQGETHASVASYNNHFGVPLTLARMPASAVFGVFEIGMSHPGEIAPLAAMVCPHVALITTVEAVHLEHFPSVAAIADEKAAIFSGLEEGGTAIINRDNAYYDRMLAGAQGSRAGRIVGFGEAAEADVRLVRAVLKPDLSIVEANLHGTAVTYRLGTPGRHIALNSLAVLAAAEALGADPTLAVLAFSDVSAPSGRGERIELGQEGLTLSLFDESYNANPASMRAALAVLGQIPVGLRGRRVAVLGDMLELGPEGERLHAELAAAVAENGIDLVFACGPLMKNLWQAIPPEKRGAYAPESESLADSVAAALRPGDAVMVKGSNGSRMALVVNRLKSRYPVIAPAA